MGTAPIGRMTDRTLEKKRPKGWTTACHKCRSWTGSKKHGHYKCYTSKCPAKARDEPRKKTRRPLKRKKFKRNLRATLIGSGCCGKCGAQMYPGHSCVEEV